MRYSLLYPGDSKDGKTELFVYDESLARLEEHGGAVFLRPLDPSSTSAWVMKGQVAAEFNTVEDATHFQSAHQAVFEVMLS
jgi:hypothetical protein